MQSLIHVGDRLKVQCAVFQKKHRGYRLETDIFISQVLQVYPPRLGKNYYRFTLTTPSNEKQTSRHDLILKHLISLESSNRSEPDSDSGEQIIYSSDDQSDNTDDGDDGDDDDDDNDDPDHKRKASNHNKTKAATMLIIQDLQKMRDDYIEEKQKCQQQIRTIQKAIDQLRKTIE